MEYHSRMMQTSLAKYCKEKGIQLEARGPLMQGLVFKINVLKDLAQKYNKRLLKSFYVGIFKMVL